MSLQHKRFPVNTAKFLRTAFFIETSGSNFYFDPKISAKCIYSVYHLFYLNYHIVKNYDVRRYLTANFGYIQQILVVTRPNLTYI